jgi:hypothetical protein
MIGKVVERTFQASLARKRADCFGDDLRWHGKARQVRVKELVRITVWFKSDNASDAISAREDQRTKSANVRATVKEYNIAEGSNRATKKTYEFCLVGCEILEIKWKST